MISCIQITDTRVNENHNLRCFYIYEYRCIFKYIYIYSKIGNFSLIIYANFETHFYSSNIYNLKMRSLFHFVILLIRYF